MGNRLILRALEKSDIDKMYIWENDRSLWNVSGYSSPFSKAALSDFVEQSNKAQSIYTTGQLRLIVEVDGLAVGCVDIFDFEPRDRRAMVGVLIYNQSERRKGYAKMALAECLNYLRSVLDVGNVVAQVPCDNDPSIRLFETLGFERVGVLKRWILFDGIFKDVVIFQRLM